jgi:hypothetical protein
MALRVERRDGSGERSVLIGMVVSRAVLGAVAARWETNLFASRWANLVGGWAVEHYTKYHKPPGRSIEHYFDRWAESGKDKETVQLVETFLSGLSEEYERLKRTTSPDHLLDVAGRLFNRVRLQQHKEAIEGDLEVGDVEKAMERLDAFRKVELGLGSGVGVLTEETMMAAAFESRAVPLIEYPDALGNFFSVALARDAFVSFMGKEKIGKSFWLMDMAMRAVEQGRRTAYFEVGDNSQHQVMRRIGVRAAARPITPGRYYLPVGIETPDGKNLPAVDQRREVFAAGLDADGAWDAVRRLGERVGPDMLKLSCHPNSTISVRGIETILEGWERDGWLPDCIFIDYADILAPLDNRAETRDQINANWKAMRALSQRLHCLVVTATQTDADSYDAKVLKRGNFSEDKRKYAHVTGMVGINQTDREKAEGLYRLNWVVLRELEFSESKCVWTAGCLAIGNPAIVSTF